MKNFILSSLLLLFTVGHTYSNPTYSGIKSYEETENDTIFDFVSKIDLPVINILTEDSIEPSCKNVMHPEGCLGQSITDNYYVKGRMTMLDGTNIIYDSGDYLKKKSGMRIKVRGNTSADFKYKSFKIKTEVKTDLLNRTDTKYENKSWVLLNIYSTRDLRTVVSFHLAKFMGIEWEPEYHFVNLFINGTYRGLYMLCEGIGVSEGRCNIDEDTGLLMENDPYWWNEDDDEPVIKTEHLPYEAGYTFKNPDVSIEDPLIEEIKNYLNAFEDSLYNGRDISLYADLKSFATWMLTHDLLGAWDGAGSNIYLMKHDLLGGEDNFQSKLCMGPLWDFDSVFMTPGKWAPIHGSEFFYFKELFKRPEFLEEYKNLWYEKRDSLAEDIKSFTENFISEYGEAIDKSRLISPPDRSFWPNTINDDLNMVTNWFEERIPWIDNAIAELFQAVSIADVNSEVIKSVKIYDVYGHVYKILKGNEAKRLFIGNHHEYKDLNLQQGVYIFETRYTDGKTISSKHII